MKALLALAAIAVAVIALRRRAPRLLAGSCDDPVERDYSWLWTDDHDVVGMPTTWSVGFDGASGADSTRYVIREKGGLKVEFSETYWSPDGQTFYPFAPTSRN